MRELTSEVKQELLAPFQAAEVRVRTHPYVAAYITARGVMTRLDEALPWQWSFRLVGNGFFDSNGVLHQDGVLEIRGSTGAGGTGPAQTLEFHDRGSAPPDAARGQAKQAKHAVSDCFKRCAVHVGIGRYLYELQGVKGDRIPKEGLERALAAVGYRGSWDDRHHGKIGGVREADREDEPEDLSIPDPLPAAPREGMNGRSSLETKPFESGSGSTVNKRMGIGASPRRDGSSNGTTAIAEPPSGNGARTTAVAEAPSRNGAGTTAVAEAPSQNGTGAIVETSSRNGTADEAQAPSRNGSSIKANEEQRTRIVQSIERGSGNAETPKFREWLSRNTANHASNLHEILSEDVDELIRKLEEHATRRIASA